MLSTLFGILSCVVPSVRLAAGAWDWPVFGVGFHLGFAATTYCPKILGGAEAEALPCKSDIQKDA